MAPVRNPPSWWDWELELSVHVEQRMLERGITEVELRTMLEHARELAPVMSPAGLSRRRDTRGKTGRSFWSPTSTSSAWPS